ncbi:MAG: PBP1A family penicillin-binding protein [Pseudomonadota bacterium]
MAISGKGRGPLVADRRSGSPARPAAPAPKSRRATRRAPSPRRGGISGFVLGFLRMLWRLVWGIAWRSTAIVALIVAGATAYFAAQLPPVNALLDARARGSVTFLDREGTVFAWRGETFGGQITAETVSPYLHDAVIATEDKRFYQHFGISPRGIASAIRINMEEGRGPLEGNGGSTITQQVAKLLCLGVAYDPTKWKSEAAYEEDCRAGGIWRKIKEIPFAMAMEVRYSKEEILTIYFNRAYLGAGARGFEAAAQRYFGVSANQVNPAQAAMLAGLLKAPSYYAPTNNLQRAQDRASLIIGLMAEQGFLTKDEAAAALARPASLSSAANTNKGGNFADWVMKTTPDFLAGKTTEDVVIKTTLDQRLQTAAEAALASVFDKNIKDGSKAQAAIIVMSADGAVRAMVGGRDLPNAGDFNRATQALRQTGSAFKPFVYAAAMNAGFSPADYVEDTPLTINIPGSGPWTPQNYDKEFKGMITLTQALAESRNIPAVRVSEAVGRDAVRKVATDFGITTDLAAGPALALGASEATLIDMTGAYAGILNGGSAVTPYGLVELRLKGETEPLFAAAGGMGERVISEKAARLLTYMMAQVVESGTGKRARLDDREAAGKTGTTTAGRDAWFVGFTGDYVTGVWMGYDDNTPLEGVSGGGLPAQIWREVMLRVEDGLPPKPLPMDIPEPRLAPPPASPGYLEDGAQATTVTPLPPDGLPLSTGGQADQDLADQILRDVLGTINN